MAPRLTNVEEKPPESTEMMVPTVSNFHRVLSEGSEYLGLKEARRP